MFSATKPLPLTVSTLAGESATSFASRLGSRNGVHRLITFCSDIGIDYFQLVNGAPNEVQRLAALGGVDPSILQAATPTLVDAGWFRLGEETIKFTAFNRTSTRICPRCAADAASMLDVVHHGLWQLSSSRTCAVHACHLVALARPKSPNDCFDHVQMLDGFQPEEMEFATPGHRELEDYLAKRISNGPEKTWLGRLPFHVAAQTCEMLGALLTLGPQAKRAALTSPQWAAAGTAGLRVLRDGADGLRETLKEIQDSHPIGEKLYRSHYRVFFDWLRSRDDDEDFDKLRDVVREFIFENFPVTTGSIVLGKPCPEQQVHSFSTAKQVYGLPHIRLGRKLATMGMAELHAGGNFYILKRYIPAALLSDIGAEVNSLLGAKEAAKSIGIDYVMLERLTSEGLVKRYFEDGQVTSYYHRDDIKAFIGRLREQASRPGRKMELVDISTAARRRGVMIAPLTSFILQHRVPLYTETPDAGSFRAFRLRLETLENLRGRRGDDIVGSPTAAKLLKITKPTVFRLTEMGLLKTPTHRKSRHIRYGRYSTTSSVEEFRAKHVSLDELAELSGRSANDEYIFQIEQRVVPLPLGLRCSLIFRRSEVA